MTTPVFADFSGWSQKLGALAIKCLAVAGAFLAGFFLGAAIIWALDKWVLRAKTPNAIKNLCKILLGIAFAIIVALIVFGEGSGGLFGGAGTEGNKGNETNQNKSSNTSTEPDPKTPNPILPKNPEVKPADVIIQVTLYGGPKAVNQHFYRFENEDELRKLDSLQDAINKARPKEGKTIIAIRLPPDRNDHPGDPRVITQLTEWANAQGLDVTFLAKTK